MRTCKAETMKPNAFAYAHGRRQHGTTTTKKNSIKQQPGVLFPVSSSIPLGKSLNFLASMYFQAEGSRLQQINSSQSWLRITMSKKLFTVLQTI